MRMDALGIVKRWKTNKRIRIMTMMMRGRKGIFDGP